MKCHILFSEKNKKNISKCRLLKILPRVLSVKSDIVRVHILSFPWNQRFDKNSQSDFRGKVF